MPDVPPAVFTVREVCSLLKISRSTLHRLTKAKVIHATRAGRAKRYTARELERFLARATR